MERNRLYNRDHPHHESPESRKVQPEVPDLQLRADSGAIRLLAGCAAAQLRYVCHEPFEDGQLIHVDHDHARCRGKNRSCGECVRGLLCHACNVALGYIERRYAMARAYLDDPPVRLLDAA
jgi:hypothetical protein